MLRITKEALQVATGKTDKDSRGTRMVSFSLQTVEYLINLPHRRQCLIPTSCTSTLKQVGIWSHIQRAMFSAVGLKDSTSIKIMVVQLFLYHLLDVTESTTIRPHSALWNGNRQ